MGKSAALGLVREMLEQTYVVDVTRAPNGLLYVATVMDSPGPLRPGKRYHMLDDQEYHQLLGRVANAEVAVQEMRLMQRERYTKRSGR